VGCLTEKIRDRIEYLVERDLSEDARHLGKTRFLLCGSRFRKRTEKALVKSGFNVEYCNKMPKDLPQYAYVVDLDYYFDIYVRGHIVDGGRLMPEPVNIAHYAEKNRKNEVYRPTKSRIA